MQGHSSDFRARAAERLFVAVVNQAILDVLEHDEGAEEAKRWLMSRDFDVLQSLFLTKNALRYETGIETLDLPATERMNEERGNTVNFPKSLVSSVAE